MNCNYAGVLPAACFPHYVLWQQSIMEIMPCQGLFWKYFPLFCVGKPRQRPREGLCCEHIWRGGEHSAAIWHFPWKAGFQIREERSGIANAGPSEFRTIGTGGTGRDSEIPAQQKLSVVSRPVTRRKIATRPAVT